MRADAKRVVLIRRCFSNGLGVICRVGAKWALARIIDDLRVDGWECLRVGDVEAITRGEHERFAEKVLRLTSSVPPLSLESTRSDVARPSLDTQTLSRGDLKAETTRGRAAALGLP